MHTLKHRKRWETRFREEDKAYTRVSAQTKVQPNFLSAGVNPVLTHKNSFGDQISLNGKTTPNEENFVLRESLPKTTIPLDASFVQGAKRDERRKFCELWSEEICDNFIQNTELEIPTSKQNPT